MVKIFGTPKANKADDYVGRRGGGSRQPPAPSRYTSPFDPPADSPKPVEPTPTPPPKKVEPYPMPAEASTTIGKGVVFKGEVTGKGTIRVEGRIIGTMDVQESVIIGATGVVDGNINSKVVSVVGRLNGNAVVSDKIIIESSGAMIGDIIAPRVKVAEGAVYKGRIDMEPKTLSKAKEKEGKGQQKSKSGKSEQGKPPAKQ